MARSSNAFPAGISSRHVAAAAILVAQFPRLLYGQIFVSSQGNDLNPGTLEQPFKTISRAHTVAAAGDTITVRGGLYDSLFSTITLSKSGSPASPFFLVAYPGERPILDFSFMEVNGGNRGIELSGNCWYVRGIDIVAAGDNGMHVSGSDNTIEFCSFSRNRDTGLQLSNGAARNRVINCDSYHNADPSQKNADGFAAKLDVGSGNSFFGCRAWENSDDGYDGYLRSSNDVTTTLEHCWIFRNGYLRDGSPSSGNGNGFKLGGSDDRTLRHNGTLRNCLAFDNRLRGFDQNNNRGSITLYNCTAHRNGSNYSIAGDIDSGHTLTLVNCSALGNYGVLGSLAVQHTNSWMSPFSVAADDFQSTDTAGVRGARKPDGSLPDITFLHLVAESDLVDAGTDVGIPFNGAAPDLGVFETPPVTSLAPNRSLPVSFVVLRSYPNPFNPATTLEYEIPAPGKVTVRIYSLVGHLVHRIDRDHSGPGRYQVRWDGTGAGSLPVASGVYLAAIRYGLHTSVLKLHLLR